METRYWAYISYNHADERVTRRIHRKLERFRIPQALVARVSDQHSQLSSTHLRPVFRDRDDLGSAGELSAELHAALDAAAALIVICSPAAATSHWVNEEIAYFVASGRGAKIFPIIIDGEPNTGDARECFPPALRRNNPAGIEPIAADMRRDKDGPRDAFLKLAAGVLNVPFDALKQRALRSQHRRQMLATAVATAVAVSTTALAMYAIQQRDIAELRRGQAEDLISFMLGDLRDRLQSLGRVEVLDAVGERAEIYFRTIPPSELDDHALEKQALSLRQIGEVRLDQGQFEIASDSFRESLDRWNNLTHRLPERSDYLFERGQAEFWMGYVYFSRGNLETARAHFTDYLNTSLKLAEARPSDTTYQLELLYSYSNLGTLDGEMGQTQSARTQFEKAVEVGSRLLDAEPDNVDYQFEHAGNLSWLGRLAEQDWQLDVAIEYEQHAEQIFSTLLEKGEDYRTRVSTLRPATTLLC